jgi:hypothetical protein
VVPPTATGDGRCRCCKEPTGKLLMAPPVLQGADDSATNGGRWCYRRRPPTLQESRRQWPVLEGADDVAADVSKRLLSKMQSLPLELQRAGDRAAIPPGWCCKGAVVLLHQPWSSLATVRNARGMERSACSEILARRRELRDGDVQCGSWFLRGERSTKMKG